MDIGITLVGRVVSWIPAPWSAVRLGHESTARLCTRDHHRARVVPFGEVGPPSPRRPVHIDATLKLWIRSGPTTTVYKLEATAAGQVLLAENFKEMTLEPGGPTEERVVQLVAPMGEDLRAATGDRADVKLLLTRGRKRKLKPMLESP